MSRTITAEGLRELFAQDSGQPILSLLTITHDTLPEPLRLVNDRQALVFAGQTYQPFSFELTLPADTEDEIPHVQVTMDNVGRELVRLFRSVLDPVAFQLDIVRVAGDGAHREMGPLDFSMLGSQINASTVTAQLGYVIDVLNMPATQDIMNHSVAPGLFR